MIAIIIVNFCRAIDTIECLNSLIRIKNPRFHIFLADNGSTDDDVFKLENYTKKYQNLISLVLFKKNYGFTGAHNRIFDHLINGEENYKFILLLNNDTVVEADFLENMLECINTEQRIEMVAARMMRYDDRTKVDSLGITFYKCGLASNRKSVADPLLGPCGGCALYTTELLRQVHKATGEYFDENFFCYAEDTDLAWRAVLLGYQCAYADHALVYHKGSITSGGTNSDFVLYYGIRNSLFTLVKNVPFSLVFRSLIWILVLHFAILLSYSLQGRPGLIFRLYRDFLYSSPTMYRKRQLIQKKRHIPINHVIKKVSHKFYEHGYTLQKLRSFLTELS